MPGSAPALEIDENPRFERAFRRVQRAGWTVLAGVVVAALLGLSGNGGPLARTVAAGDGLHVDYPRYARQDAGFTLDATVTAPAGDGFVLELTGPWRQSLRVDDIEPRPRRMSADARTLRMEFDAGGARTQHVRLHLLAAAPGMQHAELGLAGHAPARLRSLVWP